MYKPILNAIDAREQRIATQLEDAASIKATAQQERNTFEQHNAQIEQQRAELLTQATQQQTNTEGVNTRISVRIAIQSLC